MLEGVSPFFLRVSKLLLLSCFFVIIFSLPFQVDAGQGPGFEDAGRGNQPSIPPVIPIGPNGLPRVDALVPEPLDGPVSPSVPGGGGGAVDGQAAEPASVTEDVPLTAVGYYADASWYQVLFDLVVAGFGWLVAQLGLFLDYAINNFVVGFGEKYRTSGLGFTIDNLWGTVRDIFNLTFIFGLVYIGFQIILGTNESQAKRTIPLLVLAALLVNFSLYITKLVVDFTNLAATQIFYLFQTGATTAGGVPEAASVSIGIAKLLGISEIFRYTPDYGGGTLVYLFGMMIILLVLAYVFLAGAILITIRFVALNIYMVFSPVMFLGWVFPGFSSYTKKFWSGFLGQAFFAPAFLFMLYLSFMVVDNYNDGVSKYFADVLGAATERGLNNDQTTQSIQASGLGSAGSAIPFFAMTIVFLIASMVVARKMGAVGADTVISVGNKLRGAATGALAGGAGLAVYKMSDKAANSENRLARFAGRTLTYSGARDAAEKAYKSSPQGGWKANREKRSGEMATRKADADTKSDIKKYAKMANPGDDIALQAAVRDADTSQIMSVLRSYKVNDPEYNNIIDSLTHEQRKKILDAPEDKVSASEKTAIGKRASTKITQDLADKNNPLTTAKLTPKQVDILGRVWIKQNLHTLSNSQVEKLASDSSVLGESEKSTLKSDWTEEIKRRHNSSGFNFAEYMDKRTAKDVAALPAEVLTDPGAVPFLSDKVLREIALTNISTKDRETIGLNVVNAGGPGENYFSNTNNHYKTNW